jgi:hypothetical protein
MPYPSKNIHLANQIGKSTKSNSPKPRTGGRIGSAVDAVLMDVLRHGIAVLDRNGAPVVDDQGAAVRRAPGADVITAALRRIDQIRQIAKEDGRLGSAAPTPTAPAGWTPPARRSA